MKKILFIVLATLGFAAKNMAQVDGSIDNSFNTTDLGNGSGDGSNNGNGIGIYTTAIFNNGNNILVGGNFSTYNSLYKYQISTINSIGLNDNTISNPTPQGGPVYCSAKQSDGKIIIGGNFTTVNGVSRKGIARLNLDGTVDNSFNPGTGFNGIVRCLCIASNGDILVGGDFTTYNGLSRPYCARINTNGTIFSNFAPTSIGNIYSITEKNGELIIGGVGYFKKLLLTNGSIVTTFNVGSGFTNNGINSFVKSIVIQQDGKILVGGSFTQYNGVLKNNLVRLNSDATIDATFITGTGSNLGPSGTVNSIIVHPSGKITIGGQFSSFNGISVGKIARLNYNGSLDLTFSGTGFIGEVYHLNRQPNDKIIASGNFGYYNDKPKNNICRINTDGSNDETFNPLSGVNGRFNSYVRDTKIDLNNKIVICGEFLAFNNKNYRRIVRLNTNGQIDTTFIIGNGADSTINAIEIQQDNKILIAGLFTSFNNISKNRIVRLNTNGSIDSTFNVGLGFNGPVNKIICEYDGKILIGGSFTSYNGITVNRLVRLNIDGSIDNSFFTGGFIMNGDVVNDIDFQSDGKIIITGFFTKYNNSNAIRIVRLNSNGQFDNSFLSSQGARIIISGYNDTGVINTCEIQNDNKIIIGGTFNKIGNFDRIAIARLNQNGGLDTSFNAIISNNPTGPVNPITTSISDLLIDNNQKVIITGNFCRLNNLDYRQIARLNNTGYVDTSFVTTGITNGQWSVSGQSLSIQTDGKIILGGNFTNYNGTGKNRIVRINSTCIPPQDPIISYNGSSTICTGDSLVLTSNYTLGNLWSNGSTSQSITVNTEGSYYVTVSNGTCSSTSNQVDINIAYPPISPIITASGPTDFCPGDSVKLTSSSSSNNLWSNGATSQSITINSTGNYFVSVSNGNCFSNSNPITVNLLSSPSTPTISYNGSIIICSGDSVILSSSSSIGNFWSTGDTTQSITVNSSGDYLVSVSNGICSTTSNTISISVQSLPIINTQPTNIQVIVSNQAIFTVSSNTGTYQWQINNGAGFQNITNGGQYNGPTTGTLTISNTTMSDNNNQFRCLVTSNNCSILSNEVVLSVVNNVGIKESSQEPLFSIYPNPAKNTINLKADSKLIGKTFVVYDNSGKSVLKGKISAEQTIIEIDNLSAGIYLFSIGENIKQTFKVVKE